MNCEWDRPRIARPPCRLPARIDQLFTNGCTSMSEKRVRRFISQLGEREAVDEVYLASEKQMRANRQGNLYLQLRLTDRTGSVTGMLWNANDKLFESFQTGNYLRVKGTTQFYNGALQMIVNRIETVSSDQVDETDFVVLARADLERLNGRLSERLRGMQNPALLNLAECYLMDESFMAKMSRAPAGIKNHHAYQGGLLDHTVAVMELAHLIAPQYPMMDADVLLMGAFLHDVSKIDELSYDNEMAYTDEGQLLGHLVMGVSLLDEKIAEAERLSGEKFPQALALRLKHLIVSHHGQYDHGAVKLPMTLEAITLHLIDNIDSKIHSAYQSMQMDPNPTGTWTNYQPSIGRKLFKPEKKSEQEP